MAKARDCCGKFIKEHGMKGTKLYRVWCSIEDAIKEGDNRYGNKRFI